MSWAASSGLANEAEVLLVRSDPEPHDSSWRSDAEDAMGGANASRPEATDSFEMKRWMTRVGFKEFVVSAGKSLQFRWELGEAAPEQT